MKRLVIAALAIGAMASCTKSTVQYEQPGEISLQPVTQKATKATFQGEVYPNGEAFNVWAWWIDPNNSSKVTNYISEGTFKFNEVHQTWAGWDGIKHYPYYWPTLGSLRFAGYSPAGANKMGTTLYSIQNETFTITSYTQSADIDETLDLMWFDLTEPFTGNGTKGVPVVFKHALSWLTFKFYLKESTTPEYWTIKSVVLKGIETTANFTASTTETFWTTPTVAPTEGITVYNSNTTGHLVKKTYTSDDDAILEKTPNGVLIIPQSCSFTNKDTYDAALVIEYELKTPASSEKDHISQSVTLSLEHGTNGEAWEIGKHYIYTITFGGNEILISPTVTKWTDEDQNIEVQ